MIAGILPRLSSVQPSAHQESAAASRPHTSTTPLGRRLRQHTACLHASGGTQRNPWTMEPKPGGASKNHRTVRNRCCFAVDSVTRCLSSPRPPRRAELLLRQAPPIQAGVTIRHSATAGHGHQLARDLSTVQRSSLPRRCRRIAAVQSMALNHAVCGLSALPKVTP